MTTTLVLDTDALHDGRLRSALTQARASGVGPDRLRVILPAVAHAERLRQTRRARLADADHQQGLEVMGIEVEALTRDIAESLPEGTLDETSWRVHARDFLIAVHVHGDRVAVTSDRGPAWQGLQVLPPRAAAGVVEALM